jgi:uncharacterized cupin superfamily protein
MTRKYTRTDSSLGSPPKSGSPTPNIPIRTTDAGFEAWEEGKRFGGRELFVSRMAGASQVHVNVMVVPAGRQSCPFHYHLLEEEHFFVLDGLCILRSGEERHTVQPGDYVCFPAGQEVGHSFENPFEDDCRILAIGPANPAEIAVYPDSGKAKLRATQTIIPWPQDPMDYWAGERTSDPVGAQNGGEKSS